MERKWIRRDNSCYHDHDCKSHYHVDDCCPENHLCVTTDTPRDICLSPKDRKAWEHIDVSQPLGDAMYFTTTRNKRNLNLEAWSDPFYSIEIAPRQFIWSPVNPSQERLRNQMLKLFSDVANLHT
jgi:hypothetical protein